MNKLYTIKELLDEVMAFVQQVYLPDVCAIGAMYADWLGYGAGVTNYLAVPDLPLDATGTEFDLPGGTIMDGDLGGVKPIKSFERRVLPRQRHREHRPLLVRRRLDAATPARRRPSPSTPTSRTTASTPGSRRRASRARPMQVGPLAQVLVGYALGHEPTVRWADRGAREGRGPIAGTKLGRDGPALDARPPPARGRSARAVLGELGPQALGAAGRQHRHGRHRHLQQARCSRGRAARASASTRRRAARCRTGSVIRDGKIANYQAVVPIDLERRPARRARAATGPYEASLVGNPIADPERPLEVLRTIHSFDPCLACAIHTLDPEGREIARVKSFVRTSVLGPGQRPDGGRCPRPVRDPGPGGALQLPRGGLGRRRGHSRPRSRPVSQRGGGADRRRHRPLGRRAGQREALRPGAASAARAAAPAQPARSQPQGSAAHWSSPATGPGRCCWSASCLRRRRWESGSALPSRRRSSRPSRRCSPSSHDSATRPRRDRLRVSPGSGGSATPRPTVHNCTAT